jgi:phosphomannomutase
MLKISISGVRGIAGDSLTPEICLNFAKAFGTYLMGGSVVIGTDTRASSELIKGIVMQGLLSCGCRVFDAGIVPTPTVGLAVKELSASGGIIITASHNPPEWNGLKFVREDGIFLNSKQAEMLIAIYKAGKFEVRSGGGVKTYKGATDLHIRKILKAISPVKIRARKFRVALDSVNGAGSVITVQLLRKLGCTVIPINTKLNAPFPHGAEPTPKNLVELCEVVRSGRADIGFGQDPDADRLAFVNEKGEAVSEEYTLALCVKSVLASLITGKKVVVTNLSTTRAIEDVAKPLGGVVIRTKIGEVHVAEEMKSVRSAIGGEGNGGVIYPKVGYNRDSLTAIALILMYMAKTGKPISELVKELPTYFIVKKKVDCRTLAEAEEMIDRAREFYKKETLDLTEGVKVYFKKSWIHIRASNTEPIVRIIAEAPTFEEAEKLTEDLILRLNP